MFTSYYYYVALQEGMIQETPTYYVDITCQ